ncbi:MAG: penicillin-binding transpeptidase domain-containing protein, partial [Thermodesulfobacteriota bacterium]
MKEYKNKLFIATIILAQAFLILTARMWYLQILKGNEYERFSLENRIRITKFPAPRGKILDRLGRELVVNRLSFDVYIFPNDVNDIDSVSRGLSYTIGTDVDVIRIKITKAIKENRFKPTLIAKDINRDQLAVIEARKISLPGVFIQINHIREYPYGNIGAHLLGYLGKADKNDYKNYPSLIASNLVGKYGVEKSFEKYLRGEDGYNQKIIDAYGREVKWHLLEKDLKSKDSVSGFDVFLSINLNLQKAAEESLGKRAGAIVVLDVRTGELLALVSHPSYNPEDFTRGMDTGKWNKLIRNKQYPLLNRATQGTYA